MIILTVWIVFFIIVRSHDCLYFGHGSSNKLVLRADSSILLKGLLVESLKFQGQGLCFQGHVLWFQMPRSPGTQLRPCCCHVSFIVFRNLLILSHEDQLTAVIQLCKQEMSLLIDVRNGHVVSSTHKLFRVPSSQVYRRFVPAVWQISAIEIGLQENGRQMTVCL